jgi:hypothetical protein
VPDAKAQKNFIDPESRIMKSKDGFVRAHNAQIVVDAEAQIIVAHDVTQSGDLAPRRAVLVALSEWRRLRDSGVLGALTPAKR